MDKEEFIRKWRRRQLTLQEKSEFEKTLDADELRDLYEAIYFYKELEKEPSNPQKQVPSQYFWLKPIAAFAMILLLAVIGFNFLYDDLEQQKIILVDQSVNQTQTLELPDASIVMLNKGSRLRYDQTNWASQRKVYLDGEAYFEVEKGSKFDVITKQGKVTVVGTAFNVIEWGNYFEVTCIEGAVNVSIDGQSHILKPGGQVRKVENSVQKNTEVNLDSPSWIKGESSFQSVPYYLVVQSLERTYDLEVKTASFDTNQIFSGRFPNNDVDIALQSITIPLNLEYSIKDNEVTLSSEID